MPEWVTPRHSGCSHGPTEGKWYFWIFRVPTCKSRADKIRYQQLPIFYLISRVQWEVSNKERDFEFCCPPDLRAKTLHGSRPNFTYLDRSVAVAIEIFYGHVPTLWEKRRKRIFFFFWIGSALTRSMLTWSTLPDGPYKTARPTRQP